MEEIQKHWYVRLVLQEIKDFNILQDHVVLMHGISGNTGGRLLFFCDMVKHKT